MDCAIQFCSAIMVVSLAGLAILGSSCKPKCTQEFTCYSPTIEAHAQTDPNMISGQNSISWCSDKAQSIPCDCYKDDAYTQPHNYNDFDTQNLVTVSCAYRGTAVSSCIGTPHPDFACNFNTGSNVTIYANNDYTFHTSCVNGTDNAICPEFDPLYFDFNSFAYDQYFRPFFIEFGIDNFNLAAFDYKFQVVDHHNNIVDEKIITENNNQPTFLRHISPDNCQGVPCYTQGTIEMDLYAATLAGEGLYQLKVMEVDAASNETEIISNTVNVRAEEAFSNERVLDLKIYKTANLDLSSYSFNNNSVPFSNAILETFSDKKANLKFRFTSAELIGFDYVDSDDDLMLDEKEVAFNGNSAQILHAFNLWTSSVYTDKIGSAYNNTGFGMEASFIKIYDLQKSPAQLSADNADFVTYAKSSPFSLVQGITSPGILSTNPFYVGTVLFQENAVRLKNNHITSSSTTVNEIVLVHFLHELGHVWSNRALDSSTNISCFKHTNFGKGKDLNNCLFKTNCPITSWNVFYATLVNTHTFCEGHRQIFMNQLVIQ